MDGIVMDWIVMDGWMGLEWMYVCMDGIVMNEWMDGWLGLEWMYVWMGL